MNPSIFHSPESRQAVLQYYDTLLQSTGGDHQRLTLPTRHGDTFVLAVGRTDAPPLILLHGSGMNSVMWAKDMLHYGRRFRVYAPDMPGEPSHSAERQLPFDTHDYADWLVDVMDGLDIRQAPLMGISLGAWLAIQFAVAHAERATKLVLLCPAGVGPQNGAFKEVAFALLSKGEAGVDELFAQINGGEPIPESMLTYQKLIASSFRTRQEPVPPFTDVELSSLRMPCALFFGAKDIMLDGPAAVERFRRLVPQAQISLFPERGHSLTGLTAEAEGFLAADGAGIAKTARPI